MTSRGRIEPDQQIVSERIAARLVERFRGVHDEATVRAAVDDSLHALAVSKARQFVPLLAEKLARERLEAAAHAAGVGALEVLFVCGHNSGRSQIAAALLEHRSEGRLVARSAGSNPRDAVLPTVVCVMAELGVDLSDAYAKPLTDEFVRGADVIVTMGCDDDVRVVDGKRYEDWDVPDPSDLSLEQVRGLRDEIDRRVRRLLDTLERG